MADISSATSSTLTASALLNSTALTQNLAALQVQVTNTTGNLSNLSSTVQTSATILGIDSTTLNLSTSAGTLSISLAQLSTAVQQNLVQQLMALFEKQQMIDLSVQPGSPPSQAVLLLPLTTSPNTANNITSTPSPQPLLPQPLALPPLTVGSQIEALVISTEPLATNVPLIENGAPYTAIALQPLVTPTPLPEVLIPTQPQSLPVLPAAQPTLAQNQGEEQSLVLPQVTLPSSSQQQTPQFQTSSQNTSQPPSVMPENLPTQPSLQPTSQMPPTPSALQPQVTQLLQPGQNLILTVTTLTPPQPSNTPVQLPSLGANQFAATVVDKTPDGKVVLQTDTTILYVKTPISAPVGSSVIVTAEAVHSEASAIPLPLPKDDAPTLDILAPLAAALAQNAPQLFQQLMNTIPQPNENLAGVLLQMLGAFKKNNIPGWIGEETAKELDGLSKGEIIARLSRDLGETMQTTRDPTVGEWHSYPLPLFAQEKFQALTLYVHQDRNSSQGKNAKFSSGTPDKIRFLINLKLSELGPMQLDGFVQNKQLDIMLRSENRLPEGLHQHLRTGYIHALGAVGYSGSLNFQIGRHTWLRMQKEALKGILT